jgi:hypothetical protein
MVVVKVVQQVVLKCPVQTQDPVKTGSIKSDFGHSQFSSSTDPYNWSYEDERRNLIEGIKALLQAKLEALTKIVKGTNLTEATSLLRDWRTD